MKEEEIDENWEGFNDTSKEVHFQNQKPLSGTGTIYFSVCILGLVNSRSIIWIANFLFL